MTRCTLALGAVALAACSGKESSHARSPVERSIEQALGTRFGVAVVVRCFDLAPVCDARLPDGVSLPISMIRRGAEFEWHVIGLVVTSDQLEAYLRDEVADLGAPQAVRCAPRIHRIAAGDRIECGLERGGKGFITVRADGSLSIEVVLDASSANARSEPRSLARDLELMRASKALDSAEETGEDPAPSPAAADPHGEPSP